jgi:hypothetical protein
MAGCLRVHAILFSVYTGIMPHGFPQEYIQQLLFRHLQPQVRMGTASDRYAGWVGQIYSAERYHSRIGQRTKVIGERTFTETVLPVESVAEYFEHFPVLEIDFTFYRPLFDQHDKPTQAFQTLKAYQRHLRDSDNLILKVLRAITAPKLRRGATYQDNPAYLDSKVFTRQFYEPANEILGPALTGFIFEQEYLTKQDRLPHLPPGGGGGGAPAAGSGGLVDLPGPQGSPAAV